MQFRRTAVAVAIAGIAAASPQIASADTVLSGAIGIQIGADDLDVVDTVENDDGTITELDTDSGDPTLSLDGAVVGIVATHTMDNGLDAYGSVRFDGDGFSGSGVTDDNIYLGIKGGFGDIRVGEVPVAAEYGQVSNDIFDQTGGINAGISYVGAFGPASIGVNFSPERNDDLVGVGAKFGVGGFSVGVGAEERDDLSNFSVGASYGFAGASISAHYAEKENGGGQDDTEIFGVNVGYGFAGASVGLTYMIQELEGGAEDTAFRIDVGYGLGGGFDVSARFTTVDGESSETSDKDDWRILLNKSF